MVGAVAMAALAYLQSVFQGQPGIVAVVAGIGCVVVTVVLNALLAWDAARKRAIPATSAGLMMTAAVYHQGEELVGYAFPVTSAT